MSEEYYSKSSIMNALLYNLSEAEAEEMMITIEVVGSADVAPVVHGHWAEVEVDDVACVYCSICKAYAHPITETSHPEKFSYCPHCGAKMDESEENDNV